MLRLFLEKKSPKRVEKDQADKIVGELGALLFDTDQRDAEGYFGNVEDHEFVDYEYRVYLSSLDCSRLIEKIRVYLEKLPWEGKFQVVKRFGVYDDVSAQGEYVRI